MTPDYLRGQQLTELQRDARDLAILRDMDAGMSSTVAAGRNGVSPDYPRALRRRVLTALALSEVAE